MLAAVETGVAAAILLGLGTRWALLSCLPLFAVIWAVGQGFGLPFTPGTTDLNSGPVYALLALALWRGRAWERWSVDAWVAAAPRPRRVVVGGTAALGVLALAGLGTGSALVQLGLWRRPAPAARAGAALALDAATGRDILVGGCGALGCDGGTWAWSAGGWRHLDPATNPPAVGYAGLAPVPGSSRLVLFGGAGALGAGPTQGATWLFDGHTWRRAHPAAAPPPRRFAAMAADPAIPAVVLFGGDDGRGHVLGGTWLWNGRSWRRAGGPGPSPRTGAALAFDPSLDGVVLFGGNDGQRRLGDTWLFVAGHWRQLHPRRSPPARAYVAMATDPQARGVVLLAGPATPRGPVGTWTLTRGSWTPHRTHLGPPAATLTACATAPAGRGIVCFGGATPTGYAFGAGSGGFGRRLWRWAGGRWTPAAAGAAGVVARTGDR